MERRVALLPTQKFVPCGEKKIFESDNIFLFARVPGKCAIIYIFLN